MTKFNQPETTNSLRSHCTDTHISYGCQRFPTATASGENERSLVFGSLYGCIKGEARSQRPGRTSEKQRVWKSISRWQGHVAESRRAPGQSLPSGLPGSSQEGAR